MSDKWAELREEIERELGFQDENAAGHDELAHDQQAERSYGRIEALREILRWMDYADKREAEAVITALRGGLQMEPCSDCQGVGYTADGYACTSCLGTGELPVATMER